MKKYTVFFNPLAARVLFFIFTHLSCQELFSQPEPMSNVGIGTTSPTRAKLEVFGTGGIFSFTSAIFGSDGAGISLQRNRPAIGFNQYNDVTSKFMTTGYAGIEYFDPATGIYALDMLGSGTANANTTVQTRSLTIGNNGNISIKTATGANASLYVIKGGNVDGSAIFGGTQYGSYFHYSATEDTYVRGGINGSSVIINDIPNGKIQMGNGSTKVGINTLPYSPLTALEVNGAVSLRAATINIVNGSVITVGDRSFISINATQTGVTNGFSITAGISPGQILILTLDNSSPASAIIFEDAGIALAGSSCNLLTRDTLMLIWTGARWVEVSRSANHFG